MTTTTLRTAHTPGPWRHAAGLIVADGGAVATLPHNQGVVRPAARTPDEHAANARLIAAAPELLEALQAFESLVGDVSDRRLWPTLGPVADRARAAIAKATGS